MSKYYDFALWRWALVLVVLLATINATVAVSSAASPFGIASFDGAASNADGSPSTQAGDHPFKVSTKIVFDSVDDPTSLIGRNPAGSVKDLRVSLPAGFAGIPKGMPACDPEVFHIAFLCDLSTQVGIATIDVGFQVETHAVYNLTAPRGKPAFFGFQVLGQPVYMIPTVRNAGDHGLTMNVLGISQVYPLFGTTVEFWGVPADSRHDGQRCGNLDMSAPPVCAGTPGDVNYGPNPAGVAPRAFLANPTACTGPLTTGLTASSWQDPDHLASASFLSHDDGGSPVGATGCEGVPFDPSIDVTPERTAPDAPTGLSVDLKMPQDGTTDPEGITTSALRKAVVTLPEGMTLNPGSADGLQPCSDASLRLGSEEPVACPDASKIGTVTATSPLIDEQLTGDIVVRPQGSTDPESGELFRIALVLSGTQKGISVRLPGQLRADKQTGRLQTTFDNSPQLPVSEIKLRFNGGPRAALVTPATCGQKTAQARLTSWSGKTVDRSSVFAIDCTTGLGGFTPTLSAGTVNPVGGAFSPFNLSIAKPGGNADLTGLTMQLPAGLLAKLKGNVGTQVGTVIALAGPGSNPYPLSGQVVLEGQYGDAPFSLKVVVPAKAGPFDLGTVVVRQRVYVDPIDAHVTVVSDPLPTIVSGVPVRLQRLDLSIDKAGFIVNPTSCAPKAFTGTLNAVGGQSAPINVRFQAGGCSSLPLKPRLALTLSGKGQTTDGKHPAITATLAQPAGQTNLKKVRVTLPLSLALDPDNSNSDTLCSFAEGSKPDPKCPASSVVGKAAAVSSILNEPLSGPVFFVKNERRDPKSGRSIKTTPKLVIPLVGENGVKLVLTGASTVVDDQLVTTFDNIPDAPVSSFRMDIAGGKKGILVISGDKVDICKATQIADQQVDGQNGKAADTEISVQTPSCPTKILSTTITAKTVALKIGGLGAGKVTVTGRGIKKTTRTIARATVATVTAKRTGKAKPGAFKVRFAKAKAAAVS